MPLDAWEVSTYVQPVPQPQTSEGLGLARNERCGNRQVAVVSDFYAASFHLFRFDVFYRNRSRNRQKDFCGKENGEKTKTKRYCCWEKIIKTVPNYSAGGNMRQMRVDLFGNNGRCPICAGHDGYLAVPHLWFGHCVKHQVFWRVTAEEAGAPAASEEESWESNMTTLSKYRQIRPCFNLKTGLTGEKLEKAMTAVKSKGRGGAHSIRW